MGTLTCAGLVDEVRALVGREGSDDQGVITDARVTRWINEAQDKIEKKCPGLSELEFRNPAIGCATTAFTHTLATDTANYAISDLTFAGGPNYNDLTDERALFISNVWHVDGANSLQLIYHPVDEFDEILIDPTSSEVESDRPTRWTRRNNNIEVSPRPSSTYNGDGLRIDGMRSAQDFTTNDTTASEIDDVDEGLIMYGTAKAWGAIGNEVRAKIWMKKFTNPRPLPNEEYGWLEDFQDSYSRMEAWDANVFTPSSSYILAGN